jgi:hypothetical protein
MYDTLRGNPVAMSPDIDAQQHKQHEHPESYSYGLVQVI